MAHSIRASALEFSLHLYFRDSRFYSLVSSRADNGYQKGSRDDYHAGRTTLVLECFSN